MVEPNEPVPPVTSTVEWSVFILCEIAFPIDGTSLGRGVPIARTKHPHTDNAGMERDRPWSPTGSIGCCRDR